MQHISTDDLRQAINQFLQTQYEKKADKQLKALDKAREAGDSAAMTILKKEIADIQDKYTLDNWMEEAATRLANQLNFGTHISKGIHPDAKGDNITFSNAPALPATLIGTQSIAQPQLDANGNAAALPLANFFDWPVTDNICIRDIIQKHPEIAQDNFATDPTTSAKYLSAFQASLSSTSDTPQTHERNKQILWPIGRLDEEIYHCLIPLYPSALTHHIKNTIDDLRWSETNKAARDNRFKVNAEKIPYISLNNLAILQLGGTKPQNISRLMSKQSGRNYLLPSLPPTFSSDGYPSINSNSTSLFNKTLYRHCALLFQALSEIIQDDRNTVHIREYREVIVKKIITRVLNVAQYHRNNRPAGWSRQCDRLDEMQVFWLDPGRSALTDEQDFTLEDRCKEDWQTPIKNDFANWAIARLKMLCKEQKTTFADAEIRYWRTTFIDTVSELSRDNQEIWT